MALPSDEAPCQLGETREADTHGRMLFEGLGPSIFVGLMTVGGVLIEANGSVLDVSGLKPADVLGKPFAESYWWSRSSAARAQLREAITRAAGGEASRYDAQVRGMEDEVIDVDFSLHPLRNEHGDVIFLVPSAIIITERKRAEHALRESNEKFHQLADNISDAFWIRSPDLTEVQYVSPAFERIWGRSVASLYAAPKEWTNFIVPEDRERVRLAYRALTGDVSSLDLEYRITRPGGEVRWVRARGFQVRDGANMLIRHVGIVTDITDRKHAETALRESEERYRALVDWSPEAIGVTRDGKILFVNAAARLLLGATSGEDLIGRSIFDMLDPAFHQGARTRIVTPRAGVDAPLIEQKFIRLDGTVIDVEVQSTHIVFDGQPAMLSSMRDITERRRTELALASSMEEFRTLAEAVPQLVWITGPSGANIYSNQQWCEYTGLGVEDSLGYGWLRAYHPADAERSRLAWDHAMATEGIFSVECRLRRADGVYRWWLIRGVAHRDSAGHILKWFGTCTDIDDLKVAELEISVINRALKMLSRCNEALIRADDETQLLEQICEVAVEGGYRMAWAGYAQEDARRSVRPVAHAGVEEAYLTEIAVTWDEHDVHGRGPFGQVIRSGKPVISADLAHDPQFAPWSAAAQRRGYRSVICLPLRDASRTFGALTLYSDEVKLPSEEELSLLLRMADDVAFGVGSLRARSERQRLEGSVREQATLLDSADEAILVKDLEARVTYWNKGAERLYGWSAAEMIGHTTSERIHKSVSAYRDGFDATLSRGEWHGEMSACTKDGRALTVEVRWTLVRDGEGQPKSILAFNSDITATKALRSQLMVSDRMASVGTLAAGVAHEINNPLAAVIANLDFIVDALGSSVGSDLKEALGEAREAAERVRFIVRDLKAISRSPNDEHRGPVVVKAILESSLRMAWNEIRHRAHVVKLYGDVPPVVANEARLGQVFLNLIVNAAQALPEGQVEHHEIRLVTRLAGREVVVEVCDTGPGIPREILDRIFDPFFTTKAVGVGTGLGLAICQRIVTDMKGTITVDSALGKGTTFRVTLPAAVSDEVDRDTAPAREVAATGLRGRILLVDDDALVLRSVTRILAKDHDVLAVSAAKQAMALIAEGQRFDLILCDLMMPDTTGMDLHRELARTAPEQANRMIFLSGGAFTEHAQRFLSEMGREHIEKPFHPANLRSLVQRHLRGSKG